MTVLLDKPLDMVCGLALGCCQWQTLEQLCLYLGFLRAFLFGQESLQQIADPHLELVALHNSDAVLVDRLPLSR